MYSLQQEGPDSFTILNQDGEVVAWVRGAEIAGFILDALNKNHFSSHLGGVPKEERTINGGIL